MFIYISRRVLWEDLNEEQLLELEDQLLADGAREHLEDLWGEGLQEIPFQIVSLRERGGAPPVRRRALASPHSHPYPPHTSPA
jgi:hypothetical protein